MRFVMLALILASLGGLSACGDRTLRHLPKPGEGPDEFKILPGKPLEEPGTYSELPAPTPGQANLTDPNPLNDGVSSLGGRRGNPNASVPARDGSIVNHVSRFGSNAAIRDTLAAEDADFRRRRGRFTNIRFFKVDRYRDVYRREMLDQRAELNRWRRAGARTPSAPE